MEGDFGISDFIRYLGHNPLLLTYPVRFRDRCVFQYSRDSQLRVCKIRPESDHSYHEYDKGKAWFEYNGIVDFHYMANRGLFALDMPWLGETLSNLENIMLGYDDTYNGPSFYGFTPEYGEALISELVNRMHNFAQRYGLVHNDLFADAPNNILYLPGTNYLTIIDPEAFTTCDKESWERFTHQMGRVRSYMFDYLVTNKKSQI